MANNLESCRVVLVEDNPADSTLLITWLAGSYPTLSIQLLVDGEKAIELVHSYRGAQRPENPALFVLDLNLPRENGKGVIRAIRAQPEVKHVPILVLSGTDNPEEKQDCLQLGANRFCTKPRTLDELESVCAVVYQLSSPQCLKETADAEPSP